MNACEILTWQGLEEPHCLCQSKHTRRGRRMRHCTPHCIKWHMQKCQTLVDNQFCIPEPGNWCDRNYERRPFNGIRLWMHKDAQYFIIPYNNLNFLCKLRVSIYKGCTSQSTCSLLYTVLKIIAYSSLNWSRHINRSTVFGMRCHLLSRVMRIYHILLRI